MLAKNGIERLEVYLEVLHAGEAPLVRQCVVHWVCCAPALVLKALEHFMMHLVHFIQPVAEMIEADLHKDRMIVLIVWEEDTKHEYIHEHWN